MTARNLAMLFAAAVLATGCMGRTIVHLDQSSAAKGRTVLLETIDTKSYWVLYTASKRVFWECSETGAGLECRKACDVKDDQGDKLACPRL